MSDVEVPMQGSAVVAAPAVTEISVRQPRVATSRLVGSCLLAGDVFSGGFALASAAAFCSAVSAGPGSAWLMRNVPISLLLLVAIYCGVGLYRPTIRSLMERFRLRMTAIIFFIFNEILLMLYGGPVIGYLVVPFAAVAALALGLWAEHFISNQLMRRGLWGSPTAIFSDGEEGRALARLFAAQPDLGLHPVGFVSADVGTEAEHSGDVVRRPDLPLLGSLRSGRFAGVVIAADILAVPESVPPPCDRAAVHRLGFKSLLIIKNLGEIPTFGTMVRHFDRCVALEIPSTHDGPSPAVKRTIDLLATVPFAILAAPLVALLAVLVKLTDPGPAFYGQMRIGHDGKPIRVLKLRTMYRDADQRLERMLEQTPGAREEWERFFKVSHDPRILPGIGAFLRRSSLDELPQLWNVIRGDMSLVGPRPFPGYHMDAFNPCFRALRVSVPPGLTGLWQISARSNGDIAVQEALDSFYIRNRSLWLDIYILLATLPAVLSSRGAK